MPIFVASSAILCSQCLPIWLATAAMLAESARNSMRKARERWEVRLSLDKSGEGERRRNRPIMWEKRPVFQMNSAICCAQRPLPVSENELI